MSNLDALRLPPSTYSRIKEHDLRFLIPSNLGGLIIGKEGENIKKIRDETQTIIILPRVTASPERILSIQSSDFEIAIEAFLEILRVIMVQSETEQEKQAIRLLVNSKYVGRFIGRNGDGISKLRERLSAHIKVYHEPCPNSTDRVIQITGYMEDVEEALRQIVNNLKSIEKEVILDDDILYDANNFDREISEEYGGYSSTFRVATNNHNVTRILRERPRYTNETAPQRSLRISRTLSTDKSSSNSRMIRTSRISRDRNLPSSSSSLFGISSKTIARRPKNAANATIIPLVGSTQVSVPNYYVGRILGHSGETIRKIRITSRAKIDIRTNDNNVEEFNEETLINITGSPKSISVARFLLEQAVLDANSI